MAKPDKRRAAAEKIVKGWLAYAAKHFDLAFAPAIYPTEFDAFNGATQAMNDGLPPSQWDLGDGESFLKRFQVNVKAMSDTAERAFKDLERWYAKEPAKGMAFLDRKLGLGGKRSAPYTEVAKSLRKLLAEVEQLVPRAKKAGGERAKQRKGLDSGAKLLLKVGRAVGW